MTKSQLREEFLKNFILKTDSYKISHWLQYPELTEYVASYFEARKGAKYQNTLFFGLQYILQRHFCGVQVTREKIDRAERIAQRHVGQFNREGWEYILNAHGGKLPLVIRAVPEGTLVNGDNVLLTVVNTDKHCFWLTNYAETILTHVWYPTMVATQSYNMKLIIKKFLEKNGDDAPDFKLHDFGYRGVTCCEQAAIGGASHLLNFRGTDTIAGMEMLEAFYNADEVTGFSIPASEHSTITSWGRDGELEAMANMLEKYPTGLVACVSDSFNIYKACRDYWGKALKGKILSREGVVVIRPDSGDPKKVLPEILNILAAAIGYTTNSKGFKVLDKHVRVIQGDGVDAQSLEEILNILHVAGWSADNLAFGSGGGLLQKLNRDIQKFAFKCSAAYIDGQWHDVYKSPVDDKGKQSKKGLLKLVKDERGVFSTANLDDPMSVFSRLDRDQDDQLVEVFRDGELTKEYTFDEIVARIA